MGEIEIRKCLTICLGVEMRCV